MLPLVPPRTPLLAGCRQRLAGLAQGLILGLALALFAGPAALAQDLPGQGPGGEAAKIAHFAAQRR